MILEIVKYGHPALRAKGKRIETIDERLRTLATNMLDTMNKAEGVGLAAQQIGMPIQLCVIDVRDVPKRPSWMWIDGKKAKIHDHMPMILCNPEVELIGEPEIGVEGCLSFPGITADVVRPERVRVQAMGINGESIAFEATGLLARAVQHEHDHLHGILFIDRLNSAERTRIDPEIKRIGIAR